VPERTGVPRGRDRRLACELARAAVEWRGGVVE
jgi:hypothetical protein